MFCALMSLLLKRNVGVLFGILSGSRNDTRFFYLVMLMLVVSFWLCNCKYILYTNF
jgi:lipoprotein signal peptidase